MATTRRTKIIPLAWSESSFTALAPAGLADAKVAKALSRAAVSSAANSRNRFRHRIEPAFRKWLAAQQPLYCQRETMAGAVARDGFVGVVRARRVKPACPSEKWRHECDIGANQQQKRPRCQGFFREVLSVRPCFSGAGTGADVRGSSFSSSSTSGEKSAVATELRG